MTRDRSDSTATTVGCDPTIRLFGTLPSEGRTSMQVYARQLAGALTRAGVNADLHTPVESALPGLIARLGRRYLAYQGRALGLRADVNHVLDHGYGHLILSLPAERTVVTFHDALLLKMASHAWPATYRPRRAMLGHRLSLVGIGRAARVLADSQSARMDLLSYTRVAPERVVVVPLGVEERYFHAGGRLAASSDQTRDAVPSHTILHIGSCAFYKNVEAILHALPAATKLLGAPVTFLKAGAPFRPEQLQLIARLGIEDQIRHLGVISDGALPALYRRADAFVFPSLYEGFGLPVLEAMASGTPVITSRAGSLPEVAGDAAIMIEPTDGDALAEAIASLLGDSHRRQELARRGIAWARRFTWEATARRTLAVYQDVLAEAGWPRGRAARCPLSTVPARGTVAPEERFLVAMDGSTGTAALPAPGRPGQP